MSLLKSEARNFAKEFILKLSPEDKSSKDKTIFQLVVELLMNKAQKNDQVLSFSADRLETNLRRLELELPHLNFYYPRLISGTQMEYVKPRSWSVGAYGLEEPLDGEITNLVINFNWILVPSLGYSNTAARLGRGRGYYDRALNSIPRDRVFGIGYYDLTGLNFQSAEHDLSPGSIITENGVLSFLD